MAKKDIDQKKRDLMARIVMLGVASLMALSLVFPVLAMEFEDGEFDARAGMMVWGLQGRSSDVSMEFEDMSRYDGLVVTANWYADAVTNTADDMEREGMDVQAGLAMNQAGMVLGLMGMVALFVGVLAMVLFVPTARWHRNLYAYGSWAVAFLALVGLALLIAGSADMANEIKDSATDGTGIDVDILPGASVFLLPVGIGLAVWNGFLFCDCKGKSKKA